MRTITKCCLIIAAVGRLATCASLAADKAFSAKGGKTPPSSVPSSSNTGPSYAPIPTINYAVIKVSSSTDTQSPVFAYDDAPTITFCWDIYSYSPATYFTLQRWQNGALNSNFLTVPFTTTVGSTTTNYKINGINVSGTPFGSITSLVNGIRVPAAGSTPYPVAPVFSSSSWSQFGWEGTFDYIGAAASITMGNNTNGYYGQAFSYSDPITSALKAYWVGGSGTANGPYCLLFSDGVFYPPLYSAPVYPDPLPANSLGVSFSPASMSDTGLTLGVSNNGVYLWNGPLSTFTQPFVGPTTAVDIDDQGHALVNSSTGSTTGTPALLQATASPVPTPQLLNTLLAPGAENNALVNEVDFDTANNASTLISNEPTNSAGTPSDHSYWIVCPATFTPPPGQSPSAVAQFAVFTDRPTLNGGVPVQDNWSFAQMVLPANVSVSGCEAINPDGVITATGVANTAKPDGTDLMLLLPVKINFAKPHDATWSWLPEKEVLLFEDETHIDVKIPMALTSLTQVMAIPELSTIHLTTNVTEPGGVDVPITFANTAFLSESDTGQPYCELRIVLQRSDIQNLGLLPANDDDNIDEKTWYDWGSQDTTSTHNLTDSAAFDAASPAVSLGKCSVYGHLGDQPPKKPNSPLDKTYLQAAGREVLTASIGGLSSWPRAIAHQADTFYISAEGHIATGLIDTDGPNSDSVTFGASDAEWTHSLKTVIIGGCSVLNIKGYRSSQMTWGDYGKYLFIRVTAGYLTSPPSPGEAWEPTGPKYLLGYAFHAPTDVEGSATIASTYETLVVGGMNPIQAWGQANNGTRGNNACAIDCSVSPHQYWYLKRSPTSPTGLTWASVTKTGAGWP